ncbi:LLM class flavin-dependent oxidoreductase [Pseudohalioglobus sediminis]|uniref:LLM class flavin-dependent oxidoreductase n=1 Tax=Pseudohalioglobus sediminis TaxID=2606449 RepID=A0A5B0X3F5_9GAMM|nr:LLM class flavin-dependent oxidoreductase [Pseudohalioglobus sediminis]KAA1193904.1 LLM class flavin-dependent oxidoreductase [Pseudohalioglobus sediminis]
MKIGICLPYMKAGLTREDYMDWFRAVDEGPFHSISCGERVHGPTYDMRVLLAAAAAATRRVEITPTLYVLPMHSATNVAKEVATLDILSGNRVKNIAVGYGGREQDYEAVGARFHGRYGRMDRQVEQMQKIWGGQEIIDGCGPIGPTPTWSQAPRLLAGAMGPKSIERCAQWADGLYAWSGNGEQEELQRTFAMADAAWERAGRGASPYRLGGFWYTLAEDGQRKLYDYVYEYLAIAGPEIARMMAESVHRSGADELVKALDNAEAAGCEEVFLVPATAELVEIQGLADILHSRG